MTLASDENAPPLIGKYRILAELGRGGMANVYLAVSHGLSGFNKLVVLKTIRPHLVEDQDTLEMFLDEARLAGRLNHPNVVHTLEVVEEAGQTLMVMEYLEGQPFGTVLKRAANEKREVSLPLQLRVVIDALQGLHYAHELKGFDGTALNLVHRDVSPQNIFVCYDGQIKVLDFGIAKAVTSSIETKAGVIKGKIAYMPPEQLLGDGIDRRADIFAMGAVLWQTATGRRLWKGVPDVQLIGRLMRGDIPTPSSVKADVDPELERIVMKALAPEPADRYPTALALQEDLEALMLAKGWKATAREIGSLAGDIFDDLRTQITQTIESQLSQARCFGAEATSGIRPVAQLPHLARSGPPSTSQPGLRTTGSDDLDHSLDGSTASSQLIQGAISPPQAKKSRALIIGLAVVGLLAVGAVLNFTLRAKPTPVAPVAAQVIETTAAGLAPSAETTPSGATEAPRPQFVQLSISAKPAGARIYIDDREQPTNPIIRQMPWSENTYTIRVEAAGHAPQEMQVPADKDSSVTMSLEWAHAGGAAVAKTVKDKPGATVAEVPTADAPPTPPTHTTSPPTSPPDNTAGGTARDRIKSLDKTNPWDE